MVPKIAIEPNLVARPRIKSQLPTISEYAAMYERTIGKGKCKGRTNASAKFVISFVFSNPWWIIRAPVKTLKIRNAKSLKIGL